MASETWRVVLADGSVRGVEVITDIVEGCPPEYSCGGECSTHSAHDAVVLWLGESLWPSGHMLVREILAPGEMTRAEAIAAERDRCARACDAIERDCRAMVRTHRDAGRHAAASEAWEMAGVAEGCAEAIRKGGRVMDTSERARLRALCEAAPTGDVVPCCERAGHPCHPSSWSIRGGARVAIVTVWDTRAPMDLFDAARTAIPALLDALETTERERDEAHAEARAAREHTDRAVDEIRRTLPAALRLAAEDEREACAAFVEEHGRVWPEVRTAIEGIARAIRARGAR